MTCKDGHNNIDIIATDCGVLDYCPKGCNGEGQKIILVEVRCATCKEVITSKQYGGHDEDCKYYHE